MFSEYLRRIKIKLSIDETDEDALLEILIEDAYFALVNYLGVDDVPAQFKYIVEELAIKRYRKLGSEGLKSEQIDVISNTFEEDPLSPYFNILDTYKRTNRKLRML